MITFDDTASSVVVLDIDPASVRGSIRGQRPDEAIASLEQTWRLQAPPQLTLGPDWLQPILRKLDLAGCLYRWPIGCPGCPLGLRCRCSLSDGV